MTAVVSQFPTSGTPTRPARPGRLRLTRRGRALLATLAVAPLIVVALLLGLGAGGAVATNDAATDSLTWVTVEPGQSLWELAAEIAPSADPREFVAQVAAFNRLESAVIQPGQELALPPHYAD